MTPPLLELPLEALHSPPPYDPQDPQVRAIINFRDPACRSVGGQGGIELAHSVDFRQVAADPDPALDWNTWVAFFQAGTVQWLSWLSDYGMGGEPIGINHERRPTPGLAGNWYMEQYDGLRSDISEGFGEIPASPVVSNGAINIDPDFLELTRGVSLVAFQSDLGGSNDIYLYAPSSFISIRVTWVDGWAGSPAWSR